jgi:hypothetical protein
VSDAPTENPRLVLDEASIEFGGLSESALSDNLELLSDALRELECAGHRVFVCPLLYDVECQSGVTLGDFLFVADRQRANPEVTRRLVRLFDRCTSWTEYIDDVAGDVWVDGEKLRPAFSVDYALTSGARGLKVACIVFPACDRRGPRMVRNDRFTDWVYFFGTPAITDFWRSLFQAENTAEPEFFRLAALAFPDLVFSPSLSFGKFAGSYHTLRDRVVQVLGAINDHFAAALAEGRACRTMCRRCWAGTGWTSHRSQRRRTAATG